MNSEGYKDPTAEKAIHNAEHIPKHIREPLDLVRRFSGCYRVGTD